MLWFNFLQKNSNKPPKKFPQISPQLNATQQDKPKDSHKNFGIKNEALHHEKIVHVDLEVLKTFKDETHKNITFKMVMEKTEQPNLENTPFIILLCKDNQGYYWPDSRSIFEVDEEMEAFIQRVFFFTEPVIKPFFDKC